MAITLDFTKLLPSNVRNTLKWKEFIQAFQAQASQLKDEKIDRLIDQWDINKATETDLRNIITKFGWYLLPYTGWTTTKEYLKRQAKTLVERILHKSCESAYKAEGYIFNQYVNVYPLVKIIADNSLSPFLGFSSSNEQETIVYILDSGDDNLLYYNSGVPVYGDPQSSGFPDTFLDTNRTVITLDQDSYIDSITRNILYSYTFNYVENATEFINTNSLKSLNNDVDQIRRLTEKIYYEPTIQIYFTEYGYSLSELFSTVKNWVSIASSSTGSNLIAIPENDYIYTSIDTGENWNVQSGSGSRLWKDTASSSYGDKLFAIVDGGYIYKSTNSGTMWTAQKEYALRDVGPAGGYVFYKDGSNYLECASTDQSSGIVWSNIINKLDGTSRLFGSGQLNTTNIINQTTQSLLSYNSGDSGPGGGIVFCTSGGFYLECTPYDVSSGVVWSNIVNSSIATHADIGSGQLNTTNIVNQTSPETIITHNIGDAGPAGGTIFFAAGNTYYELSPYDQSSGIAWSNLTTELANTSESFGSGQINTTNIVNQAIGYNIGDLGPAGGIVFFGSGSTYYEITSSNISSGILFSNISGVLSKTSTNFGSGQINTTNIVNQISEYAIGDVGQAGGYVFYRSGSLYYEAAPVDQTAGIWGRNGDEVGTDISFGSGQINTTNMTSGSPAANSCISYSLNGYNDWFLPSEEELNTMLNALYPLNVSNFITENTGYWSSTEQTTETFDEASYFYHEFLIDTFIVGNGDRTATKNIRAIRTFDLESQPCTTGAAYISNNLSEGGYDDWYLPSKDELNLVVPNLAGTAYSGTLGNNSYWTSSEYASNSAYIYKNSDQWDSIDAIETNSWKSVTYGENTFIAVSSDGSTRAMRSVDLGLTWNVISGIDNTSNWYGVSYGNSVFVSVSQSGYSGVMRSTDLGETWNLIEVPSDTTDLRGIAYGANTFVAVAYTGSNRVIRSTDYGETWTSPGVSLDKSWVSIAYGNNTFVATSLSGSVFSLMYSNDLGVTWNNSDASTDTDHTSIAYGNGIFIATSVLSGEVIRSTNNGVNWTVITTPIVDTWASVVYGNQTFYLTSLTQALKSTDYGLTWTTVSIPANRSTTLTFGNNVFIGVGEDGIMRYSPTSTSYKNTLNYVRPIRSFINTFQYCTSGAAYICDNLTLGGYDDWFLPSKNELELAYVGLTALDSGVVFPNNYYWTSSESGSLNAYTLNLSNGSGTTYLKSDNASVRAIRSFIESGTTTTYCVSGAAYLCDNLTYGGYSDWYLPSKDELNLMYINLKQHGFGNFNIENYWNSTETTASQAGYQFFFTGSQSNDLKGSQKNVRAVRNFNPSGTVSVTTGAAKLCNDLIDSSYSDWYLPSQNELNLMYTNLSLSGVGGFISSPYWTSSESGSLIGYSQNLSTGEITKTSKDSTSRVRAVRSFTKILPDYENWSSIASSSDGSKLAITILSGSIWTSNNSIWNEYTSAGNKNWYDVTSTSDGVKLSAIVYGGNIWTSSDSGLTWTEQIGLGNKNWSSITCSSDNSHIYASVYGGYIYLSTNNGILWQSKTTAGSRNWSSVACSSNGKNIIASVGKKTAPQASGSIYISVDYGVTWEEIEGSENKVWTSVSVNSAGNKFFATEYNGYLYTITFTSSKTTNYTDYDNTLTANQKTIFISQKYSPIESCFDDILSGTIHLGNSYHTTIDDSITDVKSFVHNIDTFDLDTSLQSSSIKANFRKKIFEKAAIQDFTEAAFFDGAGDIVLYSKFPKVVLNSGSLYSNINFVLEKV